MDLTAALLVGGAYLWGAVPVSYLVGRYRKGIDIRDYGSGNVGATNLMTHVGPWTGFIVGVFDCLAKGTLPVLIARELFDLPLSAQAITGLAAIAGHSWSPYLLFTGGRGVATAVGVIFSFFMWEEMLVIAVILGAGRVVFHETGLWTFVSMLALPILALVFSRDPEDRGDDAGDRRAADGEAADGQLGAARSRLPGGACACLQGAVGQGRSAQAAVDGQTARRRLGARRRCPRPGTA